ncbi:MAG TPA: PspC domain-containing protein [Candidatus Binatia bacterium]|jgi:phage shock protein PspC (stress-responsive transcriptional regulator)
MADVTKLCPYCAEEIRGEALKCRYCGSTVDGGTALSRTWYRRRHGKMMAGVCAGLADQFGISVTIIRLAFLLSALLGGGVGIIVYLALWVVMPYGDTWAPRSDARMSDVRPAAAPPEPQRFDREILP